MPNGSTTLRGVTKIVEMQVSSHEIENIKNGLWVEFVADVENSEEKILLRIRTDETEIK